MNNEEMRPHTVCFTGDREIKHASLSARLDSLLADLYAQGFRYYRAGGALGFDTEAALSVLRTREQHPEIKLILTLPFPGQSTKWSSEEREQYEDIKHRADDVIYTSEKRDRNESRGHHTPQSIDRTGSHRLYALHRICGCR